MNFTTNDIIKYFAQSSIQFTDLFTSSVPPNRIETNRYTAPYCNGLVLTLSGHATFSLNGTAYEMNSQTMLHAGPSMLINIKTPPDTTWEYIVLHFKNHQHLNDLMNQHFILEITDTNKISYFLQQLITLNKLPGNLFYLKSQRYLMQLIETILVDVKVPTGNSFVEQALLIIAENYNHPITINEIAEQVGCERRKLAYLFEKQMGISPIQYLTEYRLKQAKNLLHFTSHSISEIAELIGYNDIYYFSRVFKKHFDMSPTEYRHRN